MTVYKHSADSIKENNNKQFVTKAEKDAWNNNINNLSSFEKVMNGKLKSVQDLLGITVRINSKAGNIFKNGKGSTTLTAQVFKGTDDITNTIDESKFKWTRTSNDQVADQKWNSEHINGTRSIEIDASEIDSSITFNVTIL